MADFLKILESKIDFSPTERGVAERWFRQVERDSLFANSISSGGGGAGVTSVDAGNVSIDLADGLVLKNPDSGDATVRLDSDGDAWFGKNIGNPDDTTMFIISNDNLYNGESFGAGDLLIGSNSAGKGNMWWDASEGKLYFRSGTTKSVEIGDGGIVASWGEIGGWKITATTIEEKLNQDIILNSAGTIQVGSGSNYILIDGVNDLIRSSNYSEDASGWQIDEKGNAEFNDITARGTLKTVVFEYQSISAIGGRLWVSKHAGTLDRDCTTPVVERTINIYIRETDSSTQVAWVDDRLVMRVWNGTALVTAWWIVTVVGSPTAGVRPYTVRLKSGNAETLFLAGAAVVNVGPSGSGVIDLEAGEETTRMRVFSHSGSPWSGWTNHVVLGNMRNTYDTGANNRYGIGIGDYSSGNYLSYNAKNAGEFLIVAGAGSVTLNATGFQAWDGANNTVRIDADGDAFFGSNLASPATTALAVFASGQTYNSEAVGYNDLLIGDNSAGKANMLWDRSYGWLRFRSGTTTHAYITGDGKFSAGGGKVYMDENGLFIQVSGIGYESTTSLTFKSAGAITHGYMYAYEGGAGLNELYLIAKDISGETNNLVLISGDPGEIKLYGDAIEMYDGSYNGTKIGRFDGGSIKNDVNWYHGSDKLPISTRIHGYSTYTMEYLFDDDYPISGYSWATYSPFGDPGGSAVETASILRVAGFASNYAFYSKAASANYGFFIPWFSSPAAGSYVGLRWDDGSNNNFMMVYAMNSIDPNGSGYYGTSIGVQSRLGGGATNTTHGTWIPYGTMMPAVCGRIEGTKWTSWTLMPMIYTAPNSAIFRCPKPYTASFTPTRIGIAFNPSTTAWRYAGCDALQTA